jgi:hypothetical protein
MGLSNLFVNMTKAYQQSPPELVPRKLSQPLAWVESSLFGEVITVGKLLSSIQPVPSDSVLLGQCSDGLPFLLELVDPDVGAILIGCDAGCGKTHQLQVMVDSARRVKSPQQLKISILTHDPREWVYLQQDNQQINYVEGIHAWYDVQAEQLIQKITDLAEARRDGQQGGTMFLFIMDDINFVENLSYQAQINLRWLLEYGSQSNVWMVGTINAGYVSGYRYWIDTFRTRIIGKVLSKDDAETLTMRCDSQVHALPHASFQVWTAEKWLKYQLLPLGD